MKGKAILETVFEMKFPNGNVMHHIHNLDAQGSVDKLKQLKILLKLCDVIDEYEVEIESLKSRISSLEEVKNVTTGTRSNSNTSI